MTNIKVKEDQGWFVFLTPHRPLEHNVNSGHQIRQNLGEIMVKLCELST